MSQRLTGFDICLPGIVAGLTLAAVLLAMGEAEFPDPFRQVFPRPNSRALVRRNWRGQRRRAGESLLSFPRGRRKTPAACSVKRFQKQECPSVRRNRCFLEFLVSQCLPLFSSFVPRCWRYRSRCTRIPARGLSNTPKLTSFQFTPKF